MRLRTAAARVMELAIWGILRLFGIELTLREVRERHYESDEEALPDLRSKNSSAMLTFAKDLYSMQEERAKLVFEKSKNLVTVSTLLIALLAALPSANLTPYWRLLPLLFVLLTLALVLFAFGLNTVAVPNIEAYKLTSEDLERLIAEDYYKCERQYARVVDFLADVYRAARRSFFCGILSLSLLAVISAGSNKTHAEKVAVRDTTCVRH